MTFDSHLLIMNICCPCSHGLRPKKKQLLVSVAEPPAPVRVPCQRPLVPSVASVTSVANDKIDNETTLGAVHSSPGICLTAEENSRKPQLGDRLMKGLCLKWGPFPRNEFGRIEQHVRKGEGRMKIRGMTSIILSRAVQPFRFLSSPWPLRNRLPICKFCSNYSFACPSSE